MVSISLNKLDHTLGTAEDRQGVMNLDFDSGRIERDEGQNSPYIDITLSTPKGTAKVRISALQAGVIVNFLMGAVNQGMASQNQ